MADDEAPLTAAQKARMLSAMDLVKSEASRLAPRLRRHLAQKELESLGHEGLIAAARVFDPSEDNDFRRFARYRVRGAMLDGYLREAREDARIVAVCQRAGDGFVARQQRVGDVMTDIDGKAEDRLLDHAGGLAMSLFAAATGAVKAEDPEDALARRELNARAHAALRRLLRKLPPREAEVVTHHYFAGQTLQDVGKALRIPHPGAYRLHDRAVKRLGALLRHEGVTELPPREDEL